MICVILHQNLAKSVKSVKKQILTSVWNVQHTNTGQNVPHTIRCRFYFQYFNWSMQYGVSQKIETVQVILYAITLQTKQGTYSLKSFPG